MRREQGRVTPRKRERNVRTEQCQEREGKGKPKSRSCTWQGVVPADDAGLG